jgi:lysophospholipase L1-like esterase
MQFLSLLLLPVLALSAAAAPACKKAIFVLSGDSTTAVQSANGGGWGSGFKNTTLLAPSFAENHALNGRSTKTFIENGDWDGVLDAVEKYKPQGDVYVTIQFGHNDQKLENFTEQFEANLKRMAADVKSAGGVPVGSSFFFFLLESGGWIELIQGFGIYRSSSPRSPAAPTPTAC